MPAPVFIFFSFVALLFAIHGGLSSDDDGDASLVISVSMFFVLFCAYILGAVK